MKEVDYIIVGCGLASITFCEYLRQNTKSFVVYDNNSQQSSIIAAGLYNPVILKRFSEVWKAKEQLKVALPLYHQIERYLKIKIDYKLQILRRFASIQEQNLWFDATDKTNLKNVLSPILLKNDNSKINAPFGFGEVLHAGRIDTKLLINSYKQYLQSIDRFQNETFNYSNIRFESNAITYTNYKAKHVIFAEGFGVKKNPYFNWVPLNGTKGEVLTIKAPNLKINYAIKASVFIIPKGNDLYTVGATYNWEDKTNNPTETAKKELIKKLKTVIRCDFETVSHAAGIRPTVKDRRPLVGQHHKHKHLYLLNGLGTRGVMIAPYISKQLYHFIEDNQSLDKAIDICRYIS